MKIAIASILVLFSDANAQASCENFAKFAAIRSYKAENGTIQGSDGINYTAKLLTRRGSVETFLVTIADNNEDGETWEVDYKVSLKNETGTCLVLSTRKVGSR